MGELGERRQILTGCTDNSWACFGFLNSRPPDCRGANLLGNQPTRCSADTDSYQATSHPVANLHPEIQMFLSSRAVGVMSPMKLPKISGQISQPFPLPLLVLLSRCSLVCLPCVVLIASNELFLGYPQCCRKPSDNVGSITDSTSRQFHFSGNSCFSLKSHRHQNTHVFSTCPAVVVRRIRIDHRASHSLRSSTHTQTHTVSLKLPAGRFCHLTKLTARSIFPLPTEQNVIVATASEACILLFVVGS
jgi:hypothetical protein